jgi:tRNA(Ile)-lysidine synthase
MPAVRLPYIRPLITSRHQEALTYLQARQLSWREDSSNTHRAYVRNRVRLDLVPILQQYNPRIVDRLNDLVAMLRADNDCLEQQTDAWMTQVVDWHAPTRVTIRCNAFQKVHLSLQRRLLRRVVDTLAPMGALVQFGHVEALRQLLTTGRTGQQCTLPGQLQAERYADMVRVWSIPEVSPRVEVRDLPVPGTVQVPILQLQLQANVVERNAVVLQPDPQQAYLDWQCLGLPLCVRFWRPGDRFHPLGAPGTKKLQDFFIDTKIPKAERATIPLVVMAETIVWVVGYRIAEPFKVRLETRSVLHLQCENVAVT